MSGAQPEQAWADDLFVADLRTGAGRDFEGLDSLFVRHGSRQGDAVALTFDDGPVDRTTEAVDILDDHGGKGTFFFVGEKVRGREDLVRRMTAAGHEVGNHSSHHRLFSLPNDIQATSSLLAGITGERPHLYRPPFGAIDTATAVALSDAGMRSVSWDVDSEDVFPVYQGLEAQLVYRNVMGGALPGSIVLMHDGQPWSRAVEALPAILTTLKQRGLRVVTVTELLTEASESHAGGPLDDERATSPGPREPPPSPRPETRRWWRSGRRRGSGRRRRGSNGRPPGDLPGAWQLPPSPISKREIMAMPAEQVVDFLEHWRPSGNARDGTLDGLERALARRVISTPKQFADLAHRIAKVEPARLRATLTALSEAVRHGFGMEWDAALTLATATLEAEGHRAGEERFDNGGDWSERARARREGGRLIAALLASDCHPPDDAREPLWSYLERLSSAGLPPDRGGSATAQIDGEARSHALEAAIDYGLQEQARGPDPPNADSEWRPRVLACLDAHLDASWEHSTPVRTVYGRHLAKLHALDPSWLQARIDDIFPSDPSLRHLREAAWNEYLAWGGQRRELAEVLEAHYRRSVAELPPPSARTPARHHDAEDPPRDPGRLLGRKLATLYSTGALDLSRGGLLDEFVDRAGPAHLGYFVRFVGLLAPEGSPLDDDARLRLMELWRIIERRAATLDASDRGLVLSRFGFWYQTGGLDTEWSDEKLVELLRAHIRPEPGFRVFQRVAEKAESDPSRAVEIARLYLELVDDEWEVRSIAVYLAAVLDAGRKSPDPELRRRTHELETGLSSSPSASAPSPGI